MVQETQVQSLVQEDTPEEEVATHSRMLAWESPGTEEPGVPQFVGLQGVRHKLATEQQRYASPNLPVYPPPTLEPWCQKLSFYISLLRTCVTLDTVNPSTKEELTPQLVLGVRMKGNEH